MSWPRGVRLCALACVLAVALVVVGGAVGAAPDPSFGTGGYTYVDGGFEFNGAGGLDIALRPDGKVVVGGLFSSFSPFVARLTSDGALDPGFTDVNGFTGRSYPNTSASGRVTSVAVDAAGRTVIVGDARDFNAWFIGRLTPSGDPDATFGTDGSGIVLVQDSPYDWPDDVAIDSRGRIVVGGYFGGRQPRGTRPPARATSRSGRTAWRSRSPTRAATAW